MTLTCPVAVAEDTSPAGQLRVPGRQAPAGQAGESRAGPSPPHARPPSSPAPGGDLPPRDPWDPTWRQPAPGQPRGSHAAHLWVDQALAVVHDAPRRDADGDDVPVVVAAAQAGVPHGLAHLLHHTGVGPPGDDPGPCGEEQRPGRPVGPGVRPAARMRGPCAHWRHTPSRRGLTHGASNATATMDLSSAPGPARQPPRAQAPRPRRGHGSLPPPAVWPVSRTRCL